MISLSSYLPALRDVLDQGFWDAIDRIFGGRYGSDDGLNSDVPVVAEDFRSSASPVAIIPSPEPYCGGHHEGIDGMARVEPVSRP